MQCIKIMLTKPNFSKDDITLTQKNMLNCSFLTRLFPFGNICLLQPKKKKNYMQGNKATRTTKGKASFSP